MVLIIFFKMPDKEHHTSIWNGNEKKKEKELRLLVLKWNLNLEFCKFFWVFLWTIALNLMTVCHVSVLSLRSCWVLKYYKFTF